MPHTVSRDCEQNLDWLKRQLKLSLNDDIVERAFTALGQKCHILYVEGMSAGLHISDHVIRPLLHCGETASGKAARDLVMNQVVEATAIRGERDLDKTVAALMAGECLLLMNSVEEAFIIDTRFYVRRTIAPPMTENVVEGPHEAFNETLRDNLTLLHRKVQSANFICKIRPVGNTIPTQVAMCYLDDVCPPETVKEMTRRLDAINVDLVQSCGMLEQLVEDDPYAPLPQVAATERPDRVISFLLEGQVVLLIDGSPRAIAMPMSFWHIIHAPDDHSMRWQYGTFMRAIRYFGALCGLLLPALFVTIVVFHPAALPMTLITSIIESRSTLPISLFGEAALMLTLFDLINEAHARVPGIMGSSLGMVSALILGTAAVQASVVSPLLIIVVALSGLGSYALPDYSLGFAFRMLQLLLVGLGWVMGLMGVMFGALAMLCVVCGMTSLNQPYVAPLSPRRTHNPDLFVRTPVFRQRLRAYLANPSKAARSQGRMRFGKGGDRG